MQQKKKFCKTKSKTQEKQVKKDFYLRNGTLYRVGQVLIISALIDQTLFRLEILDFFISPSS